MNNIGRNDPCPCGSGKKYKNCCMSKRVFSFSNYQLLYGYSPFNLPEDLELLKDFDGCEVECFLDGTGFPSCVVRSIDGFNIMPELCSRPKLGKDFELSDIVQDPQKMPIYLQARKRDVMFWLYEFYTIGFLADQEKPGLALVSVAEDEPGKFIARSEIYPMKANQFTEFYRFIASRGNYFPLGEMTMDVTCDVFIVPVWMLESFIIGHKNLDIEERFISEDELDFYLHNANEKSQRYGKEADEFWHLGLKYRKHCTYLMELLCCEEEMKTNVKMMQYKAWTEKLMKLQNSNKDVDLDNDLNWMAYQKEMDGIIDMMISESLSRESLREKVRDRIIKQHSDLEPDALEFLVQAETLYELNKEDYLDFTPIVVEYAKVLERQLEYVMEKTGNTVDHPSLGAFIYFITKERMIPYYERKNQMYSIKNIRNNGAHTGRCTIADVERIRQYYYDKKLLDIITSKR